MPRPSFDSAPWALAVVLVAGGLAHAQPEPLEPGEDLPVEALAPSPERAEALTALYEAVRAKEEEVQQLRKELSAATAEDDVTRQGLSDQLAQRLQDLRNIRARFQETAAGVDDSLFEKKKSEPFSWEQTLGRILEPIFAEIEDATATSRRIATLREEQATFGEQQQVSEEALAQLEATLGSVEDEGLREALGALQKRWKQRRVLAANQANAARLRLREFEANQKGIADYARKFLATRGLHLVWGLGAALLVFLVVRLSFGFVRRRKQAPGLKTRLVSVLASILSVVGAVLSALVVFSAAGDLFLVGIVLVFLIGAAWAGIRVLPEFVESLRLVLNVGMVKEGERLMFDDIPWRVETLGFTCRLANDRLDGAKLELPVKRLVGLHSRPFCPDEPLFPTERGDWVTLDDGSGGQIVAQSPSSVALRERGGALRIHATPAFIELAPKRLSEGSFRIKTQFGIDYAHQAIATGQVPKWFTEALERSLPEVAAGHAIHGIHVHFAAAAASSLDYEIHVDVAGSAAESHDRIRFSLQRILVDACNEHGLTIPFQQVTVHQA